MNLKYYVKLVGIFLAFAVYIIVFAASLSADVGFIQNPELKSMFLPFLEMSASGVVGFVMGYWYEKSK